MGQDTRLVSEAGVPLPLHEQHRELNYWLTLDEPSRTLYLQYNRCQNAGETLASVADRAFTLMDRGAAERICRDDVFLEVIVAPDFAPDALEMLRARWTASAAAPPGASAAAFTA